MLLDNRKKFKLNHSRSILTGGVHARVVVAACGDTINTRRSEKHVNPQTM